MAVSVDRPCLGLSRASIELPVTTYHIQDEFASVIRPDADSRVQVAPAKVDPLRPYIRLCYADLPSVVEMLIAADNEDLEATVRVESDRAGPSEIVAKEVDRCGPAAVWRFLSAIGDSAVRSHQERIESSIAGHDRGEVRDGW